MNEWPELGSYPDALSVCFWVSATAGSRSFLDLGWWPLVLRRGPNHELQRLRDYQTPARLSAAEVCRTS